MGALDRMPTWLFATLFFVGLILGVWIETNEQTGNPYIPAFIGFAFALVSSFLIHLVVRAAAGLSALARKYRAH